MMEQSGCLTGYPCKLTVLRQCETKLSMRVRVCRKSSSTRKNDCVERSTRGLNKSGKGILSPASAATGFGYNYTYMERNRPDLDCFVLISFLDKPLSLIAEEIKLLAHDVAGVSAAETTALQGRCLPDVRYPVDLEFASICPEDIQGFDDAVLVMLCNDLHKSLAHTLTPPLRQNVCSYNYSGCRH